MQSFDDISDELLALRPRLRIFALSLTGNVDRAEDLVQDTLVMALSRSHQFERGTNLSAWATTILRNLFLSSCRKKREVEDPDGIHVASLSTPAAQDVPLDVQDFARAFSRLTQDQREALLLVAVDGLSFEEVAALQGIALGTAKSRVIRGRAALAKMLGGDPAPVPCRSRAPLTTTPPH